MLITATNHHCYYYCCCKQTALLALEADARADLGDQYPGLPRQTREGEWANSIDPETGMVSLSY
jgi:hypothetical protein